MNQYISFNNKVMNFNSYGTHYANFHMCTLSLVRQNVMVFTYGTSSYESWFISRMYPAEKIAIDSNKSLILALKSFFKSDVPASVVYNSKYLWTVCLGKERFVYPVSKDTKNETTLQCYATPYYVHSVEVIHQYLQGIIRPAYENVFFYKNTILYLDNEDLPYPGGFYFDSSKPGPYYRICFLSNESTDYVLNIAAEWQSRRDVMTIPYMTQDVKTVPKFINFQPISEPAFNEANISSTGIIHKNLCSKNPEHIIQDILNSYYKNVARRLPESRADIGLLLEWPLFITFEGARYSEDNLKQFKQFVALSINGTHPSRVLQIYRPYDRYIEYNNVPPTLWTPVSFVLTTLLTDIRIKKVAIDSVIIGVVYRDAFFCFEQPLLEGTPTKTPNLYAQFILSTVTFNLDEDSNIQKLESFRFNDSYSLQRVSLKGLSYDTWCLTETLNTDPYPKKIRLPELVKQWTDFFVEVSQNIFDVDVTTVRLALMLSKHGICFNLTAVEKATINNIRLTDKEITFYLDEKIIQFINDARLIKNETTSENSKCTIS